MSVPTRTLGEVAKLLSGGTPRKSNDDYWRGVIPWLTPKDMARWENQTEAHVSEQAIGNGTRLAPPNASFVAVRGMSLHNEIRVVSSSRPITFNQDIKAIVAGPDLNAAFLYYALTAAKPILLNSVSAAGHGTGVLATDRLLALPIPVLPTAVQRAVATFLGDIDDKIELNRRMNATLEAQARALFSDWFVDFGPVKAKMAGPDAGGAPYLAPDLWSLFPNRLDDDGVPEGWEVAPLDEIADFLNGLALQKYPAADGEDSLPVIKIAELRTGPTSKSNRASTNVPEKYVIGDGDFIFSWSGSLLAKFWTHGPGALNQHLFKVTSDEFPAWFYSHWVWHHLAEFQLIAASKATTMGHIKRGHLKEAMCVVPSPDLLEELSGIMEPIVERTIANELESRTLAQTRDLLLPKLMSGEIRVGEAEREIERA